MNTKPDEEHIFHTARRMPEGGSREEYLEQMCRGDDGLKRRIIALLSAYADENELLNSANQLPDTESTAPGDMTTDSIGPYKLLQQIGEGGMGTVFMAEQMRPVTRRVALKIIKAGMDSKSVIARFEAERQALAMMDHPNIARVLDAGTIDDGRPYFVMELVKGIPITEYCDENKLTIRQRLELFIQVCQAVQHAHQKGIIHRDIKPSNVLVAKYDDQPVPKVIDFGVAKAISQRLTEKTMFTQFGQIVGTLEYMSPEQAQFNQLDVDTRSDIYSLGVLLYELLTGETPFDGKRLRSSAFEEVLRILREEEPPRPSQRISTLGERATSASSARSIDPKKLGPYLRGDLDWIVIKAMEKERRRRYDSPLLLATDLRDYLAGMPVEARPPTLRYRLEKFVRKHRVEIVFATSIATILLVSAFLFAWQANANLVQSRLLLGNAKEQTTTLIMQGDPAGGSEKLEFARTLGADGAWCEMQEGHIALQQAQHLDAEAHFNRAKELLPESTVAHSLSLIGKIFAGKEHEYLMEVGSLKHREVADFEDYLFRGLAQTWGNPRRAARDLEEAIKTKPHIAIVHLHYARALRLEAADTADSSQAMLIAWEAVGEAAVARRLLPENPMSHSEYIHANIVLANTLEAHGDEYVPELNNAIENGLHAVLESRIRFPHEVGNAEARCYYFNQLGKFPDEKEELSSIQLPSELTVQHHVIVWRRAWALLKEDKAMEAKAELRLIADSNVGRFHTLTPLLVDIWNAKDDDLADLRAKYLAMMSYPERDSHGIYAHHDIAVARLLNLDNRIVRERARQFEKLGRTLGHDYTEKYIPLAEFFLGEDVDPESGLKDNGDSNRLRAETFFLLGTHELSMNRREKAIAYFQKCTETGYYEYAVYWWSQLLVEKLRADTNWLPWLRDNKSL